MRVLAVVAALVAVATATGAVVSAAESASPLDACAVPGPGDFPGAPPAFSLPPGGTRTTGTTTVGAECILRRADGSLFARATSDRRGRLSTVEYFDGESRRYFSVHMDYAEGDGEEDNGGGLSSDRCSNSSNNPANVTWDYMPISWYLNYNSLPSYVNKDLSETNIRNAHAEWENNSTHCTTIGDASAIDYSYSGRRTNTIARDGFNIVDYGEVTEKGCSTSSHACEFTWWAVGTGNAVESDIRLDQRDSYWTNDPVAFPSRVDFWSVMAHEVGHRSLFGHVSAGDTQVMDSGTPPGTSLKRKLSRGDAIGNNTKW